MCIIVDGATSHVLSVLDEHGKDMWDMNPDGAGIAYYVGTEFSIPRMQKSIKTYDDMCKTIRNIVRKNNVVRMAVHMRKASVGLVKDELTHPFRVRDGVMFHNGTVKNIAETGESDTMSLSKIVSGLPKDWTENPGLVQLMACVIGESRLLFYYNGFSFTFGEWHIYKECYVSNTKFLKPALPLLGTPTYTERNIRNYYGDEYSYCSECFIELADAYEFREGKCRRCATSNKQSGSWCSVCKRMSTTKHICSHCMEDITVLV